MTWITAALGGMIGTLARHAVNVAVARSMKPAPYATAIVNILGSAIIGALAGSISSGRLLMPAPLRVFVFVGLLGGFTTFSSFTYETFELVRSGQIWPAAINVVGHVGLGFIGLWAGFGLGRAA